MFTLVEFTFKRDTFEGDQSMWAELQNFPAQRSASFPVLPLTAPFPFRRPPAPAPLTCSEGDNRL